MFDSLYRLLLRALPTAYDDADRAEMLEVFRERVKRTDEVEGRRSGRMHRIRELGDLAGQVLARRATELFGSIRQDTVVGVRSLIKTPLVASLAVLSLGIGIGATSAIFTTLDIWLLRPVPLPNAERLVWVGMANREQGWGMNAFTVPDFVQWREGAETVDLALHRRSSFNLSGGEGAERVDAVVGSYNLARVLGIEAARGRMFTPEEERAEGPRAVVLSNGFWQARFGADPEAVGSIVNIDSAPHVVIGVLPPLPHIPSFDGDVWLPLRISNDEPRNHLYAGVGLLERGVGLELGREELQAVAQAAGHTDPDRSFPDASVRPFRSFLYGPQYSQGGAILGAAVLFVLLIACANIANLLLVRGVGRAHELSLRAALGAGRWRIIRQLLTESLLLAALGGVVGILFAEVGLHLLSTYLLPPEQVPGLDQMTVSPRVLGVTAVLTMACAVLFGLLPALQASRPDLRRPLSAGHRTGSTVQRPGWGKILVVAEIALALSLLASASVIIRAIVDSYRVDMGFRTQGAVVFRVSPPESTYEDSEAVRAFHESLRARLLAMPGVRAVASATGTPIGFAGNYVYGVEGDLAASGELRKSAHYRFVDDTYLDVMGIELVAGRWFDDGVDVSTAPSVAVVSKAFAEFEFGTPSEALGRSLRLADRSPTIVGVAKVGRFLGPQYEEPRTILEPLTQRTARFRFYVVDSGVTTSETMAGIRGAMTELDPAIAVFRMRTLEDEFAEVLEPETVTVRIFGTLASIALLLTVVGVYGVISYSVGTRTREMGLRMALGADRRGLVRLIVGQSGRLVLIGLVLGIGMSIAAGQSLTAIFAGLRPRDPLTLTLVAGVMAAASLGAAYLPARRGSVVDPMAALRSD
ncbi:MAG: ABC transporter permease [Gemmatimonadota bacterium]|nr:ABC transporter permease [Gemmatimonadota bacterium]